uniref:Uncharacterized protein n=1 Tax=Anguilla anguilla TaxID=7936 RepID=A0A0E9X3N6_ANGAN
MGPVLQTGSDRGSGPPCGRTVHRSPLERRTLPALHEGGGAVGQRPQEQRHVGMPQNESISSVWIWADVSVRLNAYRLRARSHIRKINIGEYSAYRC